MKPLRPPSTVRGFTLMEVMVVVLILGILTSFATPAFRQLIENHRAKSASADLHAALVRSRSEAIKRNTNTTLTPVSGDWKLGWQITASGTTLEEHGALPGELTLSGPGSVTYRSSGRISGTAAQFQITGTFSNSARCIELDLSGRPSHRLGTC